MISFYYNVFRYMDIYFSSEEMKKAVEDLAIDAVYDSVAPSQPGNNNPPPPVVANPSSNTDQTQSSFARRRSFLYSFLSCGKYFYFIQS